MKRITVQDLFGIFIKWNLHNSRIADFVLPCKTTASCYFWFPLGTLTLLYSQLPTLHRICTASQSCLCTKDTIQPCFIQELTVTVLQNRLGTYCRQLTTVEGENLRHQGVQGVLVHFLSVMHQLEGTDTLMQPLLGLMKQPQHYAVSTINDYFTVCLKFRYSSKSQLTLNPSRRLELRQILRIDLCIFFILSRAFYSLNLALSMGAKCLFWRFWSSGMVCTG